MIRGYSDDAAKERTFLAWVRTSLETFAGRVQVDW